MSVYGCAISLAGRRKKLTVATNALFQISYFSECRVLTACAEEITKISERDSTVATLVKQREGFLVVGGCLRHCKLVERLLDGCAVILREGWLNNRRDDRKYAY